MIQNTPGHWDMLCLLRLSYGRRSVLVSGSPLWPMTRFYPYHFISDNCFVVLPVGRPLWREKGPVTYNAIADLSGHWRPITIHYHLIWDCVPSSTPLAAHREYSGGILTSLDAEYNISFTLWGTFSVKYTQAPPVDEKRSSVAILQWGAWWIK
jgi:glycosyltransferase involved in cell wall biosynthesis